MTHSAFLHTLRLGAVALTLMLSAGCDLAASKGSMHGEQFSSTDTYSTATMTEDAAMTARIKERFAQDDVVSGLDIHVETQQGVVTLGGTVYRDEIMRRAIALSYEVEGVTNVVSRLKMRR